MVEVPVEAPAFVKNKVLHVDVVVKHRKPETAKGFFLVEVVNKNRAR